MTPDNPSEAKTMLTSSTWAEFRNSGMLWYINRLLHLFGWAICCYVDDTGNVTGAAPVRCLFRGFDAQSESVGYAQVTASMKKDMPFLCEAVEPENKTETA